MAALREAHERGPDTHDGYRAGTTAGTRHDEHPAARWEFTWDGPGDGWGPRRELRLAWEEGGRLPDVVFEFTSRKTKKEDTDVKRPLYEQVLKVKEYFLFDPTGDYLKPRLQGYRLVGERYAAMEPVKGRLFSEQLGLELIQEGERLSLYDPEMATFEADDVYRQADATGFIRLNALRLRIQARRSRKRNEEQGTRNE